MECVAPTLLLDFLGGHLPPERRSEVESHLQSCPSCRLVASEAAHGSSLSGSSRSTRVNDGAPTLAPGTQIDRFVLLECIGQGASGAVYAAYDPTLDRRCALKLLWRTTSADGERKARLLKEARSLARLNHPHVVAVYEVATWEQSEHASIYLAEEFVRGVNLAGWLSAQPRSVDEICAVFRQAAAGLAAAHSAGIVHRDFKPANVLVGSDGRVRVVDFGMARLADAEEASPDGGSDGRCDDRCDGRLVPAPPSASLTATGTVMGTPFYMSPEQHRGQLADGRSDQFSFCVSLYEALYGERPFAATTFKELGQEVQQGAVKRAPKDKDARVPAWLRQVVLRGLQPRPDDRFASMDALLAALGPPSRPWRSRLALPLASVAVLGLLVVAGVWIRGRQQICSGAAARLSGVWDGPRRAAAQAAFAKTGLPYAASVWSSVARILDEYSSSWVAQHTEACRATRVRQEQSEEVLDLRMTCLSGRLQELRAAADELTTADQQTVDKALQVATGLLPLDSCAEVAALRAPVPLPQSREVRARVEELRGQLATVKTLGEVGKYPAALDLGQRVLVAARATHYPRVEGEALAQLGRIEMLTRAASTEATLEDAFFAAEKAGDDVLAARAASLLVFDVGFTRGRPVDGERWARMARAALDRGGGDTLGQGQLANNLGVVLNVQGKSAEALLQFRQALALFQKLWGDDSPAAAGAHANIGMALDHLDQHSDALVENRAGLASQERLLGPDHPDVANTRLNVGMTLLHLGRPAEALAEFRRALAVWQRVAGPDNPHAGDIHTDVGMALLDLGQPDEALVEQRRALAIYQETLGPLNPQVGSAHINLSAVLASQGHTEAAMAEQRRALAVYEKAQGHDVDVAMCHHNIGTLLREEQKYPEALDELHQALAIRQRVVGAAGDSSTAETVGVIGEVELLQHHDGPAAAHLRQALAALAEPGSPLVPELQFALARAIFDPAHRAQGLELARTARATYARLPSTDAHRHYLGEIDAWLKKADRAR